jgi:hypothetical protein
LITYHEPTGKFKFRAKAGITLGLGASGEVAGEISANNMVEFVQFVYHQLNNQNFDYLGFIERESFELLNRYLIYHIETGIQFKEAIEKSLEDIEEWWEDRNLAIEKSENITARIMANPEMLRFSPPETKGALLYQLTEDYWFYWEERQEDAVLVILSWIQTQREFQEVCEHMTKDGSKSKQKAPYQAGYNRLASLLDGRQWEEFYEQRRSWRKKTFNEQWDNAKTHRDKFQTTVKQKIALYPIEPKRWQPIQQTFQPDPIA